MQTAGVVEAHGRLLTGTIFENGLAPATSYKDAQVPPDARLALGSNAIDGGRTVANIDDTFSGAAPDLGALETGCTVPIYGPRPEGIDESNAPTGCGGPPNTAETTVPIQTTSLKLSDHSAPPANPAARKLRFKSKTSGEPIANRILVPAAGGAGDPTLHGATVTIYNAAGDSQQTIIALPAAAWSILGVPLAPRGYRYRAGAPGAISKVSLQRDRITLTGGGASFDYGLAAPSQGRVALRLQFGGQPPWCAAAPARRIGNPASTAASDKLDLFVTHPKTPGPIICPPVP